MTRRCFFIATSWGRGALPEHFRALSHELARRGHRITVLVDGRRRVEALAVGTPVVGSRVGGIPEIIRDGVNGFLVPPDDPAALAERLARVLDEPGLRVDLGLNARGRFLESYQRSRVVRAQADWLEEIAASPGIDQGRPPT